MSVIDVMMYLIAYLTVCAIGGFIGGFIGGMIGYGIVQVWQRWSA